MQRPEKTKAPLSVSSLKMNEKKPSEFNLRLLQIREREAEVMKAIETSNKLLRLDAPFSSR